jgi:SAM-dependent methyltransferase
MSAVSSFERRERCPACGSDRIAVAFDRQSWGRQFAGSADRRGGLAGMMEAEPALAFEAMLRCGACGTLFTDRVPELAALDSFYQSYHGNDGYLNKAARKLALEKRRVFMLKWLTSGRRFLDAGCNIGCAVEAARWNGFAATGLDLSTEALRIGRERFPRNRFLHGTIEVLQRGEVFDLVYCTEVLEHVPDPQRFLRSLAGTVASGGVLFLTTPDAGHSSVRDKLIGWDQVKPPEHIALFTKAGLRQALAPLFRTLWFVPNRKPGIQLAARRA